MKRENNGFSGSYSPDDCVFLLTQLQPDATAVCTNDVKKKGKGLPCWEDEPVAGYWRLYDGAMAANASRVAEEVATFSPRGIADNSSGEVVLASLARAGTPFGVLLVRALRMLGRKSCHYGVSLIKQYGVDHAALDYMVAGHGESSIWFVDGWTGKGGITRTLAASVEKFNQSRGTRVNTQLTVVADLAGVARMSATTDDYLVPSSPMNAPMNGLISKTYGEHEQMQPGDFHGAYVFEHLRACDRSNAFVDAISSHVEAMLQHPSGIPLVNADRKQAAARRCTNALDRLLADLGASGEDIVKHGYAETVRAIQRRPMKSLLLRDPSSRQNHALVALCQQLGTDVIETPALEFECVGVCREV